MQHHFLFFVVVVTGLLGCASPAPRQIDTLIINGQVYDGLGNPPQAIDIGICQQKICYLQASEQRQQVTATRTIDASGLIVSPGFIDPHTHSLAELRSSDKHANLNYLYQGVTTVVNGNDGGGPVNIQQTVNNLNPAGIGTNVALYVGHGSIREQVMGRSERQASRQELADMQALVANAMQQGALGLSSGLYYVPGSYANQAEVAALAKVAAEYGGIYDTHIRDESTFNIGFLAALQEAIAIAKAADIHLHLAHIKALGVDVWGQSQDAIALIEQARQQGISISADQYPWQASGTNIRSAIMPKWAQADSDAAFLARLTDSGLQARITSEITENIRRRGGADALLITASKQQPKWVGSTLQQVADSLGKSPTQAAIWLVNQGRFRVASFNMQEQDLLNFMRQDWVVTSSDGTNGHPRKYASFPQKFREYVKQRQVMSLARFIQASSGQTAAILRLNDRGSLQLGKQADIVVFAENGFAPKASFADWQQLSEGVKWLWVNGQLVIDKGDFTGTLAGQFVRPTAP